MKEIVSIQFGHCGNSIGEKFWHTICNEHSISECCGDFYGDSILAYQYLDVYFECAPNRFVPRTIFCDLDSTHINSIKNGLNGTLFNPDYMVTGASGTGNNFARGCITDGCELVDAAHEIVRKQVERCDGFMGFQMFHSINGGTGSGAGSLMLQNLCDEFPSSVINTFTVIPSDASETVTAPYNAVLAASAMLETTDQSIIVDNEAIYDICRNQYRMRRPTMGDLNSLIAMTISGISAGFRFPGQLNTDLRKLLTNMCPYPRLKFLIPGYHSPLQQSNNKCDPQVSVADLVEQIFDPKFQMISNAMQDVRYLTCAMIFRGKNVSPKEVDVAMADIQQQKRHMFVNWIPNNCKSAICDVPLVDTTLSATFLANNSSTAHTFTRLLKQFDALRDKKAFLHWYLSEGMDESEFDYAKHSMLELCEEYTSAASLEGDDDDDSENDEHPTEEDDDEMTSTAENSRGDRQ